MNGGIWDESCSLNVVIRPTFVGMDSRMTINVQRGLGYGGLQVLPVGHALLDKFAFSPAHFHIDLRISLPLFTHDVRHILSPQYIDINFLIPTGYRLVKQKKPSSGEILISL